MKKHQTLELHAQGSCATYLHWIHKTVVLSHSIRCLQCMSENKLQSLSCDEPCKNVKPKFIQILGFKGLNLVPEKTKECLAFVTPVQKMVSLHSSFLLKCSNFSISNKRNRVKLFHISQSLIKQCSSIYL